MRDNVIFNDLDYYYRSIKNEKNIFINHIEKYLGEIDNVFQEKITEDYYLNIYHIPPTKNGFYHKLVTYGVSDTKLEKDKDFHNSKYVELIICLPPSWYRGENHMKDIRFGWPYKWLIEISKQLILESSYPWYGFNINKRRTYPVANNTKQCGFVPLQPTLANPAFSKCNIGEDKYINFFNIVPLYEEEMKFRINRGIKAFEKKFYGNGITELIDVNRKNVCGNQLLNFFTNKTMI
ncbi:suppressor of fused domain protein [Clostridium sediminicola]|uniref:suppressor of fused domain protein n=1 Tax=Clostridium sediminicola TaxID=3114879 RepID=UPI0031F2462C